MATNDPQADSGPDHWQPNQGSAHGGHGHPNQAGYPSPQQSGARQQMLYDAQKKSSGTSYLLWLFFGMVGAHRFYLGQSGSGAAMLVLWLVGLFTLIVGIGFLMLIALWLWWFIDLFLVGGMVRDHNLRIANQLSY